MFGRKNNNKNNDGVSYMDLSPVKSEKSKKKSKKNLDDVISVHDEVLQLIRSTDTIEPILDLPEFLMNDCKLGQSSYAIRTEPTSTFAEHTKDVVNLSNMNEDLSRQIDETNDEIDDMLSQIDEEESLNTPVEINSIHDILEDSEPSTDVKTIDTVEDITDEVIEELASEILYNVAEEPLEPLTEEEPLEPIEPLAEEVCEEVSEETLEPTIPVEDLTEEALEPTDLDTTDVNNLLKEVESVNVNSNIDVPDAVEPLNIESEEKLETESTLTKEDDETLRSLLNLKEEEPEIVEPVNLEKETKQEKSLTTPMGAMLDMSDVVTSSIKEEM